MGSKCLLFGMWHVDDPQISHVDPADVTKIVKYLDTKYPAITATWGKIHDYLGITFNFSKNKSRNGKVHVSMDEYIAKVLDKFPEVISVIAPYPTTRYLFQMRKKDIKIGNHSWNSRGLCFTEMLLNFYLLLSEYVDLYKQQWRF